MPRIHKNSRPMVRLSLEALESRLNPANIAILDQVSHFYQVAVDRSPDTQGLAFYSAQLENGVSPQSVAHQIATSTEHNEKVVTGYYAGIFNRQPDAAGLASHVAALGRGVSEERIVASLLASAERSADLTNPAYIQLLYTAVLGRAADQGGQEFWVGTLESGASRQAVALAFLESREASTNVVDGLYASVLGRQPASAEKQGWINLLERPDVSFADAASAFLGSAEARALVAGSANPLMTVIEPSVYYWQRNIGLAALDGIEAPAAALKLNPVVQLSHFGQDIAFTETQTGITSIPITNGGSGYTSPPAVTIAPPAAGGVDAKAATANTIIQDGVITGYTLSPPPNGVNVGPYNDTTNKPLIVVSPPSDPTKTTATFSYHLSNGYIDYVALTNGGSGYDPDNPPTVKVTGATDISQNASIIIQKSGNPNGDKGNHKGVSNGVVTAITIDNSGQGYAPNETVIVTIGKAPVPANSAVLGKVTAGVVEVPSRSNFQKWAKDYITYVANTGVSTCFINIGDYLADTKGLYNYLRPDLGTNGIPWIVTDFLDPLANLKKPDGSSAVEVGAIAYLKDAWHLYEDVDNPNFEGNQLISDGQSARTDGTKTVYSPPKNNMYQALQLVNEINSYATTKFITHFEFDGEGGGGFVIDVPEKDKPSYYGFNTTTNQVVQSPDTKWSYQPAKLSPTGEPQPGTNNGWPNTGPGYTKWLWNHLMPGVAESDLAPGGKLPGSQSGVTVPSVPDVVFIDTQAVDPATWSENNGSPYQFGSISYSQPAWFPSSPGPVQSYSENYWWGENNYMPGDSSSLWSNPNGQTTFQSTDTRTYDTPPVVTFNTPTGGTPAAGYAVLAAGSVELGSAYEDSTKTATIGYSPLDPSGLITNQFYIGGGYSTGIWVTPPQQPGGYQKGETITFHNPAPGGRSFTGTLNVDNNGNLTGVTITDPGDGWTAEPTGYLVNGNADPNIGNEKKLATFTPLLTTANGYPSLTFDPPPNGGRPASGFAVVTPQDGKPGSISQIVITDPGEGYEKSSNTTLDGKSTAQLVPHLDANGKVVSISVLNPGSGYTVAPAISFVPGYHDYPTATASATALLDAKGGVASVTVNEGGAGYSPVLTVSASAPQGGTVSGVKVIVSQESAPSDILKHYTGTGIKPLAAGVPLQGGGNGYYLIVPKTANSVDHIVVTRSGDHYNLSEQDSPAYQLNNSGHWLSVPPLQPGATTPIDTSTYNKQYAPTLTRAGGFIINGNGLSLVSVVDGGAGYSAGVEITTPTGKASTYDTPPNVIFTNAPGDTTGSGAQAVANLDSTGKIVGIQIINPGTGYTLEPIISFQRATGDDGQNQGLVTDTARALIMNYPRVTITPAPGTQATKAAQAYAVVAPVNSSNPNYDTGYMVSSIQFAETGAGYIPASSGTALPAFTPANLPTMTVSTPTNPGGRQARVDSQFAIVSKWNAFWVDGVNSISKETGLPGTAPLESVGSVLVTKPGLGYSWDVQVTFEPLPAGGETAVGYAVLNADGSVNRIAITNPGSGYTSPPTATVSSPSNTGQGALVSVNTLVPKIRGGGNVYNYEIWDGTPSDQVTSIDFVPVQQQSGSNNNAIGGNVYQTGYDYVPTDKVVFTRNPADPKPPAGKPFVDAVANVATVDPNGSILTFNILNPGTGYQSAPTATVSSKTGKGSGAVIQPSLQNLILSANSADAVYAHYADSPESLALMFNDPKYTAEPSLKKLSDRSYQKLNLNQDFKQITPNLPGNGISQGAIATFSLESVLLSNTGAAAVQLGAGGGATASATTASGAITAINVTIPGANYLVAPLVQITDPKGSGATATAILAANGTISQIKVTAGGSGYTTPSVSLISQGACLDAKYQDPSQLVGVNALGGTFGGLSMLTYNDFITFLNTAADIVVGSQETSGVNLQPADYTTNGTTITSAVADFQNIRQGMTVEGVGVPSGTVVKAIPRATATATKNTSNGNWTISVDQGTENTGYLVSDLPNVVITGDGSGATATPTVDASTGKVTAISLAFSSTATTYTWMNVSIQQSQQVVLSNPVTGTPGALTFYNPISASDVTFSIYDSAFLPLSWLDGQVTNGWNENNTAATFSNLLTTGTVAPNALAGTVIYTALATDNDLLAANKRITYDLKRGQGDDASLLKINPSSGQVMLRYDASQFPRQSYTFTVVATDGGGLSVEKIVTVPVATA